VILEFLRSARFPSGSFDCITLFDVIEHLERPLEVLEECRRILKKDDDERRKWSLNLYGIDTSDASLYDVVLHIDNLKTVVFPIPTRCSSSASSA